MRFFPGVSRDSENNTEHKLASKGFSSCRPVKLTSSDETPPRCSLQHVNNGVKGNSISRKSGKQKQDKQDIETTYVHSTCSGDSTAKSNNTKLMYPRKHGKRSARTRGKNSTLWAGVRMTDTAAAIDLFQITVPPQKGKAEFHPEVFSGLNQDTRAGIYDLSSAESALASLYGESERDLSIEFAVKLLMAEIPQPNEAAEVEEFFNWTMNSGKSTKPGTSES